MLSKIKSASMMATETRSSIKHTSQISDNEEEIINDSNHDSNNNNNNNINNNQHPAKKNQDELLDIVEVSRKRRLSKDSADSLTGFIRWSFSHIDPAIQRLNSTNVDKYASALKRESSEALLENSNEDLETDGDPLAYDDLIEEDDWPSLSQAQQQFSSARSMQLGPDQYLLRKHVRLSGGRGSGGSSSANLALLRASERHPSPSSLLSEVRSSKRARVQAFSPERKYSPRQLGSIGATRKSSSHLGNVVERLHQQQQQQRQEQEQQQQQQQQQQQEIEQEAGSNAGLSFHLQQFLQQQTSLEDLCSSVGLDESNQLVLAAAIHRALVDSVGPNGQMSSGPTDTKSIASSIGSSSGASSNNNNNNNNNNDTANYNHQQNPAINASGANLHLVDSLANRGQTRAQQQRHAQAAAALSSLSRANSHPISSATPIVDFECDTCGSSFDDRHRLMQHQSIHLELQKGWYTETPVDEVMKIFNRRRGEFLCNTCNLRFEATFDYDKHNHSVHGQRPYCCQFCGNGTRTFRFWRQYLNHLYDHRYIFSCTMDNCDFTVNRRDSLRFHIFRFHLNCQLPQNDH